MFCTNCGKKIEDGLDSCPYCNANVEKETEGERSLQSNFSGYQEEYMPVNNLKKFSFIKYLLLSIITFGIYSIFLLYRFNKTVNTLCEGDNKESMNYIFVLLLGACTFGVYTLVWINKQGQRLYEIAPKYNCQLKEKGTTFLLWTTFGSLIVVGPYIAWYQMFRNINLLIENYNRGNLNSTYYYPVKKERATKTVLIIIGYYAILWVPLLIILLVAIAMPETTPVEKAESTQEAVLDFSEEETEDDVKASSEEQGEKEEEKDANKEKTGEGEEKYTKTNLKSLLRNPDMFDKQNVKVYADFEVYDDYIYISNYQGSITVIYNASVYDETGKEVGNILHGDRGYVEGIYNASETTIYASKIVLTEELPERNDSDDKRATVSSIPENTFIGVEGSYLDFTYGSAYSSEKSVYISNVTDSSFDFVIYDGDSVIFKSHSATIEDFDRATFYGQQYTLIFFWNSSTELVVQGFDEVAGMTFLNIDYLHVS